MKPHVFFMCRVCANKVVFENKCMRFDRVNVAHKQVGRGCDNESSDEC